MQRRSTTRLIAILIVAVGLFAVTWLGPRGLREARASRGWPVVEGTVRAVDVAERTRSRGSRKWTEYVVDLTYEYEVAGALHRGTRWSVAPRPAYTEREDAARAAAAFRVGDGIEVRHDPGDPSRAVLFQGGERAAWTTIGFGALLLAIGAAVFVGGGRAAPGRTPAG